MADQSRIEWTDATWNPVRGCTKVSAGCKNCYAERFAERFRGVPGHAFEQGFDVRLVPEARELPLTWRKPRAVFVNSMSDLFHEAVPFSFVGDVFYTMARARQHAFQVLTKRAARMRKFFESATGRIWATPDGERAPLPNVWLGVSVENQAAADERIPHLLATPAKVRFLSCEPLLEDLGDLELQGARVDWVIVGGESGPGARPCDVAWIRSLVKQCRAAGVPAFVKQLGAHALVDYYDRGFRELYEASGFEWPDPEGWDPRDGQPGPDARVRLRFADRKGGDPAEWPEDLRVRELPEVARG